MAKDRAKDLLLGQEGSYALLEVIGKGAYGTVYKGIWREVGRHVAVKRVSRTRLSPDEKKGLQAEISLFKNLKHQHIVNYIEAVDDLDSPYLDIVMEFVEGGSLFNMVDSIRKSLDVGEPVFEEAVVADLISQVVLGLQYLHRQGVVHRDIKGANLLVTKERHVKLADFGVSSTKPMDDSGPIDAAGSPYWMPPEIINLTGASTASDIWSLGCTVIELLTGLPPYHQYTGFTAMFKIVSDECPPLPPNLSAECEDFLTKCFNKDVQERPTADELLSHRWLARCNEASRSVTGHIAADETPATDPFSSDTSPPHGAAGINSSASNVMFDLGKYGEDAGDDFDDFDLQSLSPDTSDRANSIRTSFSFEQGNESTSLLSPLLADMSSREQVTPSSDQHFGARISNSKRYVSFREDPFKDLVADPEAEREQARSRKQNEEMQKVKLQAGDLGKEEGAHIAACNALIKMFKENPEQRYYLIYDPGLLPIIEVLESGGNGSTAAVEAMLLVTLSLLDGESAENGADSSIPGKHGNDGEAADVPSLGYPRISNIREDLCLAGFLPVVMQYCKRTESMTARLLSARFLQKMLELERVLRMFIACRGFSVFVDMLEPDVEQMGELAVIALAGIEQLLTLDKQRHKRDFCRRFARIGLLERIIDGISHNMVCIARLEEERKDGASALKEIIMLQNHVSKLGNLLQTFAARADPTVKTKMTTDGVLHGMIELISNRLAPRSGIQYILSCIRDLSRDPQTHGELESARTIETLVHYLCDEEGLETSCEHFIISSLHNLCRVSPGRQEIAARAGIIPYLQQYILSKDMNVRSLCIDMYSGLACAGHATRVELGKCRGLDFYVDLMVILCQPGTVRKWNSRVLQSMTEWLEDGKEGQQVEARLMAEDNRRRICESLAQMRVAEVEGMLEPYLKMVTISEKVNRVYGSSEQLIVVMIRWLEYMYGHRVGGGGGPRGRLLLLRTLLTHATLWGDGALNRGIISGLRVLLTEVVLVGEDAITVRELATLLLMTIDSFN